MSTHAYDTADERATGFIIFNFLVMMIIIFVTLSFKGEIFVLSITQQYEFTIIIFFMIGCPWMLTDYLYLKGLIKP